MLKRILLLLDETPSSVSARQYAFRLSRTTEARIAGLAGIDLASIEAPMLGAIGAATYKANLEKYLKDQGAAARRELRKIYEQACAADGINFEWLTFEGDPLETLQLAIESRDLVIAGHDTAFIGSSREELSGILAKLMLMSPRPIIICPDDLVTADNILVAYDGSLPAKRSLQLFTLLKLGEGKRIQVISIDANQEMAARKASGAANYLHAHDYDADVVAIASRGDPTQILRNQVTDRNIGMLVMGAYGHRGLREVLFGSSTLALLERPPCSLFVYH